jgi:hypothetical protein
MSALRWRAAQLGRQMGSLVLASDERLLCAALQVHVGPSDPPGLVASLLAQGAAALGGRLDDDAPEALAGETAAAIRRASAGAPILGLFAAVLVTPAAVRACTAGDLRVQLVRGGAVERSSRDHTAENEPDGCPPGLAAALPHHPTRLLGPAGARPPERAVWPAEPPYRVLLSSSHHHQHGPSDAAPPWPGDDFGYDAGLIIEICVDGSSGHAPAV